VGISVYIPPKAGKIYFLWCGNDVRMCIEIIFLLSKKNSGYVPVQVNSAWRSLEPKVT